MLFCYLSVVLSCSPPLAGGRQDKALFNHSATVLLQPNFHTHIFVLFHFSSPTDNFTQIRISNNSSHFVCFSYHFLYDNAIHSKRHSENKITVKKSLFKQTEVHLLCILNTGKEGIKLFSQDCYSRPYSFILVDSHRGSM